MNLPFDCARLDRRMDEAGADLIMATSKHNVQYLLGGYYCLFFAKMEAIGVSRYLPIFGYPRGKPGLAFYVGNTFETSQQEFESLWAPTVRNVAWTTEQAAVQAGGLIHDIGYASATIAVEMPFLPTDSYQTLRRLLPKARFVDAVSIFEDLRAVKSPRELKLLKEATEGIVESMLATYRRAKPRVTTLRVAEILQEEEVARGLGFDYCLAAVGNSWKRTPCAAEWEPGASLSLDSGGNKLGYIGDLSRMAVLGSPTKDQKALLREIDYVQMAAREPVRAGARAGAIYEHARAALAICLHRDELDFLAHGMGLVSHEAPRLTSSGTVPYPADHEDVPLEAGMVISIETTLTSRPYGYIKLEDTIAVTATGWEAYGDTARGWNVVGD